MKNSWAIVTGASSGIGHAVAEQLAARGVNLLITARRRNRLEQLQKQLVSEHGVKVEPLVFDVRDYGQCEAAVRTKQDFVSQVSILVNNAGLARGADPINAGKIEDWDQMIDTNIKGLLYMTRLVLPHMLARNSGHIVNLGSVVSRWVATGNVVYRASKFAVRAISEGIRQDLHGKRIRVTNIEPGAVESEFFHVRLQDEAKAKAFYKGFEPLKAKDIAESIVWCLDRPAHMNIQEMIIMPTNQVGVGPTAIHREDA